MMVDPPTNNQFPKWGGFSADSFQLPELTFVFGLQATICSVTVSYTMHTVSRGFENVQIDIQSEWTQRPNSKKKKKISESM